MLHVAPATRPWVPTGSVQIAICNRFLSHNEYCSRCWSFDPVHQQFSRKNFTSSFMNYFRSASFRQNNGTMLTALPSPSNSTGSETNMVPNKSTTTPTRHHRSL
ncbi:hypothetical protein MBANPS3_009296 [Mucor bainieri]